MPDIIKNALPALFDNIPLLPEQASTVAGEVDLLMIAWTLVSFVSGTTVVAVILFMMFHYRRRSTTETGGPEFHNPMIEIISMAIPFVVCMVMFTWGAKVFVDLKQPPADAVEYFAFGKQWMWKYQHPNGKRQINDLTIPINTPIKVTMTSEDVVHAFFVPDFRVKQDAFPGMYTTVWFEATKLGDYHMFCAEYCGTDHAGMGGTVHVVSEADYQNWLLDDELSPAPSTSGEQLFTSLACTTCHTGEDSGRGPALHGVAGSQIALANGETVVADDAFLRQSIVEPRAHVRAGFTELMPTYQGQVTEEQLFQLVDYIKSLEAPPDTLADDREAVTVAPSEDRTPNPAVLSGG